MKKQFFTALLISLRSSTAVNTEIAIMKVNKELNTLQEYKIDIIGGIIMLSSGYIFTLFYMNMDFHTYKKLLFDAISFKDIIILLIYSGLKTADAYTAIPISVLNGMVKVFIAIFSIEVLSLLIQFL